MMLSIEELAENTKKLVSGEAIVSLDPQLIDPSFVSDRVEDDEEEFALFREGLSKDGQLQPILVRPHPDAPGRYMIVFGHRRTRAARELGIPIRAVVRDLEEIAHILAQGHENSRRADLSFIEKALFARKLQSMGQSKATITSALSIDETLLSRMLSVLDIVPPMVIEELGAAKSIGRDRWEGLKKLLGQPKKSQQALAIVQTDEFQSKAGAARFSHLYAELKRSGARARKGVSQPAVRSWAPRTALSRPATAILEKNSACRSHRKMRASSGASFRPALMSFTGLSRTRNPATQETNRQRKRPPKRRRLGSPSL
jgi:ParB family chromosome partitioning protein